MTTSPGLRKAALTLHVCASVGWLGAIAVFLALTVTGMTATDPATARGAYLVMEPAAGYVLVPLAFASLITGVVLSLCTPWGLLRHYWVVFKLAISIVATGVLLAYMQTFKAMATIAADPAAEISAVRNPSPGVHSALALLILMVAMVLAIYKPRALTPYGIRMQAASGRKPPPPG